MDRGRYSILVERSTSSHDWRNSSRDNSSEDVFPQLYKTRSSPAAFGCARFSNAEEKRPGNNESEGGAWDTEDNDVTVESPAGLALTFLRPVQRREVISNIAAFDYYRLVGINSMTSYSNYAPAPRAGMNYAISRCHEGTLWLHIIAAIGAAWQARFEVTHSTFSQPLDMAKHQLATTIYSAAVRELQPLGRSITALTIESLVIATYELFAFEVAIGNHIGSLHYLRYIRALFQTYPKWCAAAMRPGTALSLMVPGSLSRLDDSSMPHRSNFTPGNAQSTDDRMAMLLASTISHKKYAFESVDEASAHLEALLDTARTIELDLQRDAQECIRSAKQDDPQLLKMLSAQQMRCMEGCVSRVMDLRASTRRRIDEVLHAFEAWRTADDLFDEAQEHLTAAMHFLRVRAFCVYLGVATCRTTREARNDRFNDTFSEIVDMAEEYLKLRQRLQRLPAVAPDTRPPTTQSNILEWGLLRALYIVCMKCRDPATRRKSRKLLSTARRREGLLESNVLAEYARVVTALEERRAGFAWNDTLALPGESTLQIREAARFCDVVATGSKTGVGTFRLVCGRFKHEATGQIELTSYTCVISSSAMGSPMQSAMLRKDEVVEIAWPMQRDTARATL